MSRFGHLKVGERAALAHALAAATGVREAAHLPQRRQAAQSIAEAVQLDLLAELTRAHPEVLK